MHDILRSILWLLLDFMLNFLFLFSFWYVSKIHLVKYMVKLIRYRTPNFFNFFCANYEHKEKPQSMVKFRIIFLLPATLLWPLCCASDLQL